MVRIEAIVRPGRLEAVREALADAGQHGISVMEIKGAGRQKGYTQHYRGAEYVVNLMAKIHLSMVVNDDEWEHLVEIIVETARTGEIGDGKIFVSPVGEVMRIRTGEAGENALK